MPFTGELGTANSMPENLVPMFGAGGHKFAQSVNGSLSFTGSIVTAVTRIFTNVSLTLYRAVYRAYTRWSTYPIIVLGDSPVGYWRLGDPSVVTTFDLSGFKNLGTVRGTVTAGVKGGLLDATTAMHFDGSTGYITVPLTNILIPRATFSVETIFSFRANASAVLINEQDSGSTTGFRLATNGSGGLRAGINASTLDTANNLSINTYYHAVVIYDGANVSIYVNGVLAAGPTVLSYTPSSGSFFTIGANENGPTLFWNGNLQEVALYNYVLTQQQITNHYTAMTTYPPAGFSTNLRTSQ